MKTIWLMVLSIGLLAVSGFSLAEGSTRHSAAASVHSAATVGHGVLASGKLSAAVASVPLQAIGAVGRASGQAGTALDDWAQSTGPLPVSDIQLMADPAPNQILSNP